MKTLIATLLISFAGLSGAFAQSQPHIYDPTVDAQQAIKKAVSQAKKEHKNVLLQIGGNWCIWCTRFHNFVAANDTLKNLQESYFVTVHVNYSPDNKNEKVLAGLDYPQRFGFPVFVVLDENGNRIHTQNSGYLEEGKGYNSGKIREFFGQWSPAAIDPATYRKDEKR